MLRRDGQESQGTFGDLTRAARSVPRDHILLRMKGQADWAAVEQVLVPYYSMHEGRPSWPPAALVRMLTIPLLFPDHSSIHGAKLDLL